MGVNEFHNETTQTKVLVKGEERLMGVNEFIMKQHD